MKTKMVKCCIVAALMIFGSTEVKAQYPAGSYVNQVQFKPYSNQIHYQTYEEAKKQAQQNGYGGYKVDDNNYVNQTAPTQDYLKTSSVNGQSAEGMIDNSGYSSSSSKTTSRSTNKSRMRRDINAESRAKSSAQSNPTGASLSRARTYERNNNIKYGRGR
jgi:hypothetical protein